MRQFLLAGACVLAIATARAGDLDVTGWRSATWGMTEEQVLAAFPDEAKRLEKPEHFSSGTVAPVGIPDYEIKGRMYRVLFGFADGKLALVSIGPADNVKQGVSHEVQFGSLEDLLIEKYGKPISEKNDADSRDRMWRFNSSTISLSYFSIPSFGKVKGADSLSITYAPRSKDANKL